MYPQSTKEGTPAIGMLLCASKEPAKFEYALTAAPSSPALVAEYHTQLPDKKLLAAKPHAFYAINMSEQGADEGRP